MDEDEPNFSEMENPIIETIRDPLLIQIKNKELGTL